MQIVRKRAYARAGLLGNPSDGYHGKTISFSVRNAWAEVVLYEWDTVEIVLAWDDRARFGSVHELARDVRLHGYYGGIRLIKATIKRFVDYCTRAGLPLHARNFSVRYGTNIPRQVGMAGSSAIIVATLRSLMAFYEVEIPPEVQPSLALAVEQEELKISGGLQDRVVQVYEGLVYMDFGREHEREQHGYRSYSYEPLDPALLPPVYVGYHYALSEPTEVFHNDIRGRFDRGDPAVVASMQTFAAIAERGRAALLAGDREELDRLVNENFETRCSIYRLPPWQVQMVEAARACGASAKFAGSGGAIVGFYTDRAMLERLTTALAALQCRVIEPEVATAVGQPVPA
jgi:glucuronokinase